MSTRRSNGFLILSEVQFRRSYKRDGCPTRRRNQAAVAGGSRRGMGRGGAKRLRFLWASAAWGGNWDLFHLNVRWIALCLESRVSTTVVFISFLGADEPDTHTCLESGEERKNALVYRAAPILRHCNPLTEARYSSRPRRYADSVSAARVWRGSKWPKWMIYWIENNNILVEQCH